MGGTKMTHNVQRAQNPILTDSLKILIGFWRDITKC